MKSLPLTDLCSLYVAFVPPPAVIQPPQNTPAHVSPLPPMPVMPHHALVPQIVWVGRAVLAATVAAIMYLSWAYGAMMRRNMLNVDDYTGSQPRFTDRVSVAFAHW